VLRRRWRALLLLSLLVGLAGGAVLTTVAGARRSDTAYDRFREETAATDLDVVFDGPPLSDEETDAAGEAIEAIPEVVAVGRSSFPFIVPAGSGFYPYLDFLALAPAPGSDPFEVDRPRIVDGALPDLRRAEEIAISETYAEESGLAVGDVAEFESFAPEQLEPLFTTGDAGPPAGPKVTLRVTTVFDAPTFLSESTGSFQPRVFLTPAFVDAHGDAIATYPGGFSVRLRDGAADAERVTAEIRGMFPEEYLLEITPASEVDRKIDSSIGVIVTALLLCALVAAFAGSVAVVQAFGRTHASEGSGARWLSALGMTRRQRVAAHVVTAVPVAVLGAAWAALGSVLASTLMPVGVARRAEPDLGVDVDGAVLLVGSVAIVLVTLLLSVLAATVVERRATLSDRRTAASPSRALRVISRAGLPPAASVGVGMAVEPRRGTAWSVRSALLGVAFGAAGVIAVIVFTASAETLATSPDRYGSPFDGAVSGFTGDVLADGGDALLGDPELAQAGVIHNDLAIVAGREANVHAFESLKGDMSLTMLTGHAPRGGREVVLGTETSDHADAGIGDEVEIQGLAGSVRGTVVGTAAFPVFDERGAPGRGVLLGVEDFRRIADPESANADVYLRWAEGVDAERANAELAEAAGVEVFPPLLPSDVNNLREVEALPRALAVFLGILGAVAAIHALLTTVRMRRQDLAVLRTLGFVRRQLGSTLAWQASAIALLGSAVGLPLGIVAGRAIWRTVADSIGVVDDPVTPLLAAVLVVAVSFLIVNLAAVAPARSARRVRAAAVLRSA
jgi:hypothetical protein